MTVQLNRVYQGNLAGAIVSLPDSTESALIAQGLAVTSAGPVTPGNVTSNAVSGRSAFAAAASSVVVTNSLVTANSRVQASLSGSAADATLTSILRVTPAAGSFTVTGNANATAATQFDWEVINYPYSLTPTM